MAIYYLDPLIGNDSNDGLSVNTAFLTYSYTRQQVTAGDKVYILPGVSNEQIILLYSGTQENPIEWIGCPDGVDGKDGNIIINRKGRCIITAFDKDGNVINSKSYFNCNTKNYNYVYSLDIEGTQYGQLNLSGNNNKAYFCRIKFYSTGSSNVAVTGRSIVTGKQIGRAHV